MAGDTQTAFTRLLDAMVVDANSPKLVLALGGILQVSENIKRRRETTTAGSDFLDT